MALWVLCASSKQLKNCARRNDRQEEARKVSINFAYYDFTTIFRYSQRLNLNFSLISHRHLIIIDFHSRTFLISSTRQKRRTSKNNPEKMAHNFQFENFPFTRHFLCATPGEGGYGEMRRKNGLIVDLHFIDIFFMYVCAYAERYLSCEATWCGILWKLSNVRKMLIFFRYRWEEVARGKAKKKQSKNVCVDREGEKKSKISKRNHLQRLAQSVTPTAPWCCRWMFALFSLFSRSEKSTFLLVIQAEHERNWYFWHNHNLWARNGFTIFWWRWHSYYFFVHCHLLLSSYHRYGEL